MTIRAARLVAFLALTLPPFAIAQTPRIDPAGIPGSLLLCGAGEVSEASLERFIDLAGGAKAKILVIVVNDDKTAEHLLERLAKKAKMKEGAEPRLVQWKDAKAALEDATGIWLTNPMGESWRQLLKDQPLREECLALLKRSGVIATSGSTSEIIGERGLALLPVLDVRSSEAKQKQRFHEGLVGIEVQNGASLLIRGRTLSAVGRGSTSIHLHASRTLPARTIELQGKAQEDLTALSRAAVDRKDSFPPEIVDPPVVAQGTLLIVGGGGSADYFYERFVEHAGGKGKATIVIFQTASPNPLPEEGRIIAAFQKAGAKKATVLNGRTQAEVESKEFLDTLKESTGLWFSGGRQWRFVDCYENTKALPLMFDVLNRGGAIGGTSAGATIQGDYLCRGGVFNNSEIRYEGYERGLGFLKGVAIDQHFSQRKRHGDMTSLMKVYPQYVGIGLDEATAIAVKGSVADVIGQGKVYFYDAKRNVETGHPDYESLSAGGRYDLKERKILRRGDKDTSKDK